MKSRAPLIILLFVCIFLAGGWTSEYRRAHRILAARQDTIDDATDDWWMRGIAEGHREYTEERGDLEKQRIQLQQTWLKLTLAHP